MIQQIYWQRILLVEDDEDLYPLLRRWLEEDHYHVTIAKSRSEAIKILDKQHFHLAIIDIRLVTEEQRENGLNEEGLELLADIAQMNLKGIMPCIVLTAHATKENVLKAFQELGVLRFIEKKPGYRKKLLGAMRDLFTQEININFAIEYEVNSLDHIYTIVNDVNWSMGGKPDPDLLALQVRDLFGKLFNKANRLLITKLRPGLTGAAVVRVQPTLQNGQGTSYVAKIGRRDKIEPEAANYEDYVEPFLPRNAVAGLNTEYSRHIGALLYTFAERDGRPLEEFDEYYKNKSAKTIIASLDMLFRTTCIPWYEGRELVYKHLPNLYFEAFELGQEKLIDRIQIVLPSFSPTTETFHFERLPIAAINPIVWLSKHRDACILRVFQCISHGDLTGRNIMVDEKGACWLIDFYRTRKSHILRDFVILETDIKYRLLTEPNVKEFLQMEELLLNSSWSKEAGATEDELSVEMQKAVQVIMALRKIANEFARGLGGRPQDTQYNRKEYLLSLLMATLNVVRLRHISEDRKLQAMLSASLICAELDELAGRTPLLKPRLSDFQEAAITEKLSPYRTKSIIESTAQERYLAELFEQGNLILLIGSGTPSNASWPSSETVARQLMGEIDYQPASDDSPTKLFTIHYNKREDRNYLISKLVAFYKEQVRPVFFNQVVTLPWQAIYTTNQHTYLEEALREKNVSYKVIVTPTQPIELTDEEMPIYKLYGCLSQEHRHGPPTTLPITTLDFRNPKTELRAENFLDRLKQSFNEGKRLLILYPSQRELRLAHRYCQALQVEGLVWVTGANFSEEDQDYHRSLGLRILPNHPPELLAHLESILRPYRD